MRIVLAGVVAAIALSGCGRSDAPASEKVPTDTPKGLKLLRIPKPGDPGFYYLCVLYSNYIGVALSCDWDVLYEP